MCSDKHKLACPYKSTTVIDIRSFLQFILCKNEIQRGLNELSPEVLHHEPLQRQDLLMVCPSAKGIE